MSVTDLPPSANAAPGVRITVPADRSAWKAFRKGYVTASVAGALLHCHPYVTAYALWADKAGRASDEDIENAVLRRGRLLEPAAVQMLREERPDWIIDYRDDQAFYNDPGLRIGATPDAYAMRPDMEGQGIVQVKTVSEEAFRDGWIDPETREVVIPLWIAVQAIVEAKMTGAPWAVVAAMVVGRGIRMEVIDIPLHEQVWTAVVNGADAFWSVVESGEEPPPDWDRDTSSVLDVHRYSEARVIDLSANGDFDAFVGRYSEASTAYTEAGKLRDLCRAQILHAMGSADVAETGKFRVRAATTIDKNGRSQRRISIKLKDQSYGRF